MFCFVVVGADTLINYAVTVIPKALALPVALKLPKALTFTNALKLPKTLILPRRWHFPWR
jgi:hypothetical protein